MFKLSLKASKALHPSNFQPRVPAGSPDGGQWTDGGGGAVGKVRLAGPRPAGAGDTTVRRDRAKGHHYVPRQLYENRALSDEARKVFEDARTGRLYNLQSNRNDRDHRIYNAAVSDLFDHYLARTGIAPEIMTPDQAP
jgi:hypothetical protein